MDGGNLQAKRFRHTITEPFHFLLIGSFENVKNTLDNNKHGVYQLITNRSRLQVLFYSDLLHDLVKCQYRIANIQNICDIYW